MKEVYVPEKFNLADNVEKIQGKINIKDFLKKRFPECLGIIIGTAISTFFTKGLNVMGVLVFGTYEGFILLSERYKNREIAKQSLKHSMLVDGYTDLIDDLDSRDLKNAVIHSRKPKYDKWWLLDGKGRVDNKKVVSYIAIPKKHKLIVFKQILNQYKYENKEMKDAMDAQIFLLEEEDLIKGGIITEDGYLNEQNPLGKKLINSNFYR